MIRLTTTRLTTTKATASPSKKATTAALTKSATKATTPTTTKQKFLIDRKQIDKECVDHPRGVSPSWEKTLENGEISCNEYTLCINGKFISEGCMSWQYFDHTKQKCQHRHLLPCGSKCGFPCSTPKPAVKATTTTTITTLGMSTSYKGLIRNDFCQIFYRYKKIHY